MIFTLRFIGVVNAAIWLGSAVFLTIGAAPAFFSQEMKDLLGAAHPAYAGALVQVVFKRFFLLQYFCASVAILHMAAEHFYLGRPLEKWVMGLVMGLVLVSLLGGEWVQPKLQQLHSMKYGKNTTADIRDSAARSLRTWHAASQIGNLAALAGLLAYFWKTANNPDALRFANMPKFKS